MFEQVGIQFDQNSLVPQIDSKSLESNIQGLYLAGSLIAGRNANKIFIENSREHGEIILSDIVNKF
jgi:thioredoxin reductase (NADPH)